MQLIRFSIIGVLNSLLDFGLLNVLMIGFGVTLGVPLVLCNAAAFVVANLNGYFFHKRWTFGREGGYFGYLLFSVGGLAVNSLAIYWMTSILLSRSDLEPSWNANIAKGCATFVSMSWNFLAYRFIVFRGGPPSAVGW